MSNKSAQRDVRAYQAIFFARHGEPPWQCYFCEEWIYGYGRSKRLAVIHHVDEDFTNNDPLNLEPAHLDCHSSHHPCTEEMARQISLTLKGRPSPTKGMTFGPEVRAKHSANSIKRFQEMSNEEHADWLQRTIAGMHAVDKTPTSCDQCERGPFLGQHGLSLHIAKYHVDKPPLMCDECGAGPYLGEAGLTSHKTLGHGKLLTGEPTVFCDCGAGPFKADRGLRLHERRAHTDVDPLTYECGKGPFVGSNALGRHKVSGRCEL